MLMEAVVGKLGMSIGQSLLKVWLKESPVSEAVSTSMFELLKTHTNDYLAARKVSRQFETIADRVGESLIPIFESYDLKEESLECVATEAAETITSGKITAKLLAEISYNHTKLYDYLINLDTQKSSLLSSDEESLYRRSLDLSAQYILDLAPQLPQYTSQNFTEILSRFDKLSTAIYKVLDDLETLTALSYLQSRDREIADFEIDYRTAIARKYDRLNLFGIDISRKAKRYQLSVAYVALDVIVEDIYEEVEDYRQIVENALLDTPYAVIVGEAGTGKTTLLQWLAVNSATRNLQEYIYNYKDTIPFVIELRRYINCELSLEFFIKQVIPDIYSKIPEVWVKNMLESGNVLLLVDGLDEIPSSKRSKVINWLEDLMESYKLHIIVTSRPGAKEWSDLVEDLDFKYLSLAPMSIERIGMFINHWHKSVIDENDTDDGESAETLANKLYYKIQNSMPILKLAANPLLCAMLCALHYDRNMQLPSDRSDLYEACCSMLLERRDAEREIVVDSIVDLTYKEKRVILNDLAYWMLRNGKTSVSIQDASEHIHPKINNLNEKSSRIEPDRLIHYLIERSGIIREPNHGVIDFIHRTFQEYMAASAAASEEDWGLLKSHAGDDLWQETIILSAGFANNRQANKLIEDLLLEGEKRHGDTYQYDLLAMCCLETAIEVSVSVREKVIERIDKLIPPKDNSQCKALAATSDLAIPFLGYKNNYSEMEMILCIQTLGMISSHAALVQLSRYINEHTSLKLIKYINKILATVNPKEVYSSNLYQSILNYIESIKKMVL